MTVPLPTRGAAPAPLPRARPRNTALDAACALALHHPDYFLPDRSAWNARVSATTRAAVHAVDRWLASVWLSRTAQAIRHAHGGGVDAARACVAAVGRLLDGWRPAPALRVVQALAQRFARVSHAGAASAPQPHERPRR